MKIKYIPVEGMADILNKYNVQFRKGEIVDVKDATPFLKCPYFEAVKTVKKKRAKKVK